MRERNHLETWHLKRFVPFGLAALLVGAACGAPDEVRRGVSVQTGGQTAGAGGSAGTVSTGAGGAASGGVSATAPASVDPGGKPGGGSAIGGKGGSVSSKGGNTSGGSAGKSSSAGGSGGAKTTFPPVGGAAGGKTAAGGTTGSVGGANGGATGTSTTPAPTSGLAVNVTKPISGATGAITFNELVLENRNSESVDLSSVKIRYWYQDDGLSTSLELATYYVSIGNAGGGKLVEANAKAASPAGPGADHYFEFSVSGTLAAQKDKSGNDKMTLQFALHTVNYQGKVDLTNDYSYNAGATGYNDKITLHSGGKVVGGTPPGVVEGDSGGGTPVPDAGAGDASAGN